MILKRYMSEESGIISCSALVIHWNPCAASIQRDAERADAARVDVACFDLVSMARLGGAACWPPRPMVLRVARALR